MLRSLAAATAAFAALLLYPAAAGAHCDALDGPVVQAARTAIERNDVAVVLRWVPPAAEQDVREAFTRTLAVRALSPQARALADTWFFETLVRIHRAGEGAPFDGLKPAGHIEPFVAAVDRSLTAGSPDGAVNDVAAHVTREVRERFVRARDSRAHADENVDAGRRFVAAYVDYLHYVEALYRAGTAGAGEYQETAAAAGHQHPE